MSFFRDSVINNLFVTLAKIRDMLVEGDVTIDGNVTINGDLITTTGETIINQDNIGTKGYIVPASGVYKAGSTLTFNPDAPVAIVSLSRDGSGVVTVVTGSPIPVVVGDIVAINANSNLAVPDVTFNGQFPVASVISSTQFTYLQSGAVTTPVINAGSFVNISNPMITVNTSNTVIDLDQQALEQLGNKAAPYIQSIHIGSSVDNVIIKGGTIRDFSACAVYVAPPPFSTLAAASAVRTEQIVTLTTTTNLPSLVAVGSTVTVSFGTASTFTGAFTITGIIQPNQVQYSQGGLDETAVIGGTNVVTIYGLGPKNIRVEGITGLNCGLYAVNPLLHTDSNNIFFPIGGVFISYGQDIIVDSCVLNGSVGAAAIAYDVLNCTISNCTLNDTSGGLWTQINVNPSRTFTLTFVLEFAARTRNVLSVTAQNCVVANSNNSGSITAFSCRIAPNSLVGNLLVQGIVFDNLVSMGGVSDEPLQPAGTGPGMLSFNFFNVHCAKVTNCSALNNVYYDRGNTFRAHTPEVSGFRTVATIKDLVFEDCVATNNFAYIIPATNRGTTGEVAIAGFRLRADSINVVYKRCIAENNSELLGNIPAYGFLTEVPIPTSIGGTLPTTSVVLDGCEAINNTGALQGAVVPGGISATILNVTRAAGVVTVNTTAANTFQTNDLVNISGIVFDPSFNGSFQITRVSSTQFTYAQALGNVGLTATGGTAALAYNGSAGFNIRSTTGCVMKNCVSMGNPIGILVDQNTTAPLYPVAACIVQNNQIVNNSQFGISDLTSDKTTMYVQNYAKKNGATPVASTNYSGLPTGTPIRNWTIPGAPSATDSNGILDPMDNMNVS